MGGTCSVHIGDETRVHNFGWKSAGKIPVIRHRNGWEDNNKMDLKEMELEVRIRLIWLKGRGCSCKKW